MIYPMIMAGGSGTRFWPLSTEKNPKQFLPIGTDKPLLRATAERVLPLSGWEGLMVVASVVGLLWLLDRLGNALAPFVIAVVVAVYMAENKLIFWFVLFSWSGLGAAFGPVVLALLYDQRTTGPGVVAGMLGGFLTSVIWVQYFKAGAYGLYEAIPGFAAGFAVTWAVSRIDRKGRDHGRQENDSA